VGIDVDEPGGGPISVAADAEQAAEDDAAVAAEQEHEGAVGGCVGDTPGERARVRRDVVLVARPARRPREVAVGWGHDVAEVARGEPRGEVLLAQHGGREVEAPRAAVVVGADADARRRTDEGDGTDHGTLRRRVVEYYLQSTD
jgi:hypothetical protein